MAGADAVLASFHALLHVALDDGKGAVHRCVVAHRAGRLNLPAGVRIRRQGLLDVLVLQAFQHLVRAAHRQQQLILQEQRISLGFERRRVVFDLAENLHGLLAQAEGTLHLPTAEYFIHVAEPPRGPCTPAFVARTACRRGRADNLPPVDAHHLVAVTNICTSDRQAFRRASISFLFSGLADFLISSAFSAACM